MIEKMVFAAGASDSSMEVIRCMKSMRKLGIKKCLLLQCYSPGEEASAIGGIVGEIYEENLARQKELLEEQGYEVETRIVKGSLENEVNDIAEKENADIIVTKATNRSLIGDAVFKGLAYEVLHKSEKPVMLVRANFKTDTYIQCDIINYIIFPTDFSENAAKAFGALKSLAPCHGTKITLVHVQDTTRMDSELLQKLDEMNEEDFSKLMDMKKELEEAGARDVEIQVVQGVTTTVLMNMAADEGVSLMIMGSQGLGFVKELYLGSVSHYMARHSASSVMLV